MNNDLANEQKNFIAKTKSIYNAWNQSYEAGKDVTVFANELIEHLHDTRHIWRRLDEYKKFRKTVLNKIVEFSKKKPEIMARIMGGQTAHELELLCCEITTTGHLCKRAVTNKLIPMCTQHTNLRFKRQTVFRSHAEKTNLPNAIEDIVASFI